MSTLLKIENLTKSFGRTKILKNISLSINEGEIISVLGPSGCGKSTMLRIISGILPPNEGTITIQDKVVSGRHTEVPTEKRDINMVFQDFALWPHLKVKDNITYGLKIRKLPGYEISCRVKEMEELLHLEGLLDRYPAELSGGQQQRVAIARALVTKPAIVLLDEPLCNLDIQLRVEMRTEMAYLFHKLGTTVFHVTHDPSEAFAMADRIIVMNQGQIDQIDTPVNCYQYPRTKTVAGLLGANNKISAILNAVERDTAQIEIAGTEIVCKYFGKPSDCGSPAELRFRPESTVFTEQKAANSLAVKIIVSTFEGSCYRVKAKVRTGESITFLHHCELPSKKTGYITMDKEVLYCYGQE